MQKQGTRRTENVTTKKSNNNRAQVPAESYIKPLHALKSFVILLCKNTYHLNWYI